MDDFLKAGGTARGMIELMGEFNVEVVGMAFVMAKAQPASKLIQGRRALMVMDLEGATIPPRWPFVRRIGCKEQL